jgi:cytochrome P450
MDRKQHHIRRTLLSPGLRANVILSYSPNLHKLVMNCADIMAGQARQAKSINLLRYARSLTVDVIGDFTFGHPMGLVNEEDEMPELIRDLQDFSSQFHLWKHFPLLRKLVTAIPKSISRKWMPGFVQLREVGVLDCPALSKADLIVAMRTEINCRR